MTTQSETPEREIPRPAVTYADHSYPAYSAKQMREIYARGRKAGLREAAEVAEAMKPAGIYPGSDRVTMACQLIKEQIEALIPKSAEVDHA
jgi:hypothetical protein